MSGGRSYLAIPGPSVIPDRVLVAMQRPAPDIYSDEMFTLAAGLQADLCWLAGTRHSCAIYIANGHGVWEAALANLIGEGDELLFLANRHFGLGWAGMARRMGATCRVLDLDHHAALDPAVLEAELRADTGHKIKAVLVVHVDTASSVRNDIAALRAVMDNVGHPALLAVDCIASFGCEAFNMDDLGVDLMVAACQKGLMTPPGIGFVFFGPKAAAARERAIHVTNYWDWKPRAAPEEFWNFWDGTAPTHHLFALRAALDMIKEEGRGEVFARHARHARAYWAALEAFGAGGNLRLNVHDPAARSHAVTACGIGAEGAGLRPYVEEKLGVTLGIGLGMAETGDPARDGYFRIGHMGHVNAHMVLGVIGALETAMIALKIAHGPGAATAAARVLAAEIR